MKIKTEPVKGKDLKPGDLFSTVGDEYWQHLPPDTIGERVYIRTNTPLPKDQQKDEVYRITIETS